MLEIQYSFTMFVITLCWILVRAYFCRKKKAFDWKRELQLMFVYICIVVVARFTFFPFSKVNGKVQPLLFDVSQIFPPRINLIPIIYLLLINLPNMFLSFRHQPYELTIRNCGQ